MVPQSPALPADKRPPVFVLTCWALGLMAFSQLLVAALALAERFENTRQVKIVTKEVPKLVVVRVPASAPEEAADESLSVVAHPPLDPPPSSIASAPLPPPTPVTAPPVADPRSERLVKEAIRARVAGDMGSAIVKLEDALTESPDDPNVHYQLGLVHEQMGVFDTASTHFEKVFQMGVSGAGSLYALAAGKLRDGPTIESPLGKLSLGRPRIYKDPDTENGQRVLLTIPVQKAPGEDIDTRDLAVSVTFFNRTDKGEILQLEDKSWVTETWTSLPFDWANSEETLRMTYVIPPQDSSTSHLFGEKSYYGQVVTLLYKGEVLDVEAWPPSLAARIPQAAGVPGGAGPEFQDVLPSDFDPNLPLLPVNPGK